MPFLTAEAAAEAATVVAALRSAVEKLCNKVQKFLEEGRYKYPNNPFSYIVILRDGIQSGDGMILQVMVLGQLPQQILHVGLATINTFKEEMIIIIGGLTIVTIN